MILDEDGLGKEISKTVERVFSRLSGQEPPLFPIPNGGTQTDAKVTNDKGKGKETSDKGKREKSNSSSKKRSFSETNKGEENDLASKSDDSPAMLRDSSKSPLMSSKT